MIRQTIPPEEANAPLNLIRLRLDEIRAIERVTSLEERALQKQFVLDCDRFGIRSAYSLPSGKRLIESHLYLVFAMARDFWERNKSSVELADLISAGTEGLLRGIEKFDPERGCRLSTYAVWRIRNAIGFEVRRYVWPMHIPDVLYRDALKLRKTIGVLTQQYCAVPKPRVIADSLGWDVRRVEKVSLWIRRDTISIETPVGERG